MAKATLLDTITYENQQRQQVQIKLYKIAANLFTVHVQVGKGPIRTKGFTTEQQANDHIVALQRAIS